MLVIGVFFISACSDQSRDAPDSQYYTEEPSNNERSSSTVSFADGVYCAVIDYYYSQTGTSARYTLKVDIENERLTAIHWPNGGGLDGSHFSPPDISDGTAQFRSDRGIDYSVRIVGDEYSYATDRFVTDLDELIQRSTDNQERSVDGSEDQGEATEWIESDDTEDEAE